MFGAFSVLAEIHGVDVLHPWVFTGLFGAMVIRLCGTDDEVCGESGRW